MYVIGGVHGPPFVDHNDVLKSMDYGVTWSSVASGDRFSSRAAHCSVVDSADAIYVIAGESSEVFNDVWKSSDGGVSWSSVAVGDRFSVRANHKCVIDSSNGIYVIAGSYRGEIDYDDVWKSSDGGITWSSVATGDRFSSRRCFTAAIDTDDSIYIAAGLSGWQTWQYLNDVWKSSDGGVTWSEVGVSLIDSGRYDGALVHVYSCLYLIGGNTPAYVSAEVWSSCDYGVTWTQMADFPVAASGLGVVVDGQDNVYVIHGGSNSVYASYNTANVR